MNTPKQFALYGVGGGAAFIVAFIVSSFLVEQTHFPAFLGSMVGYAAGFALNFLCQAWITFETKTTRFANRMAKFLAVQIAGFFAFSLFVEILTGAFGAPYKTAFLASAGAVLILNFFTSKFFAFR